jgi:hypothetical protein
MLVLSAMASLTVIGIPSATYLTAVRSGQKILRAQRAPLLLGGDHGGWRTVGHDS